MVYIVFSKKIAVSITSFMNKELSNCGVVAFALTDDCQRQTSTFKQSKVIVTSLTTWENFCRKKGKVVFIFVCAVCNGIKCFCIVNCIMHTNLNVVKSFLKLARAQ